MKRHRIMFYAMDPIAIQQLQPYTFKWKTQIKHAIHKNIFTKMYISMQQYFFNCTSLKYPFPLPTQVQYYFKHRGSIATRSRYHLIFRALRSYPTLWCFHGFWLILSTGTKWHLLLLIARFALICKVQSSINRRQNDGVRFELKMTLYAKHDILLIALPVSKQTNKTQIIGLWRLFSPLKSAKDSIKACNLKKSTLLNQRLKTLSIVLKWAFPLIHLVGLHYYLMYYFIYLKYALSGIVTMCFSSVDVLQWRPDWISNYVFDRNEWDISLWNQNR